jgi:uncharacterized protein (TIGR02265 family)
MAAVSDALALVAPYCDLVERLRLVPPSASLRGIYFKHIEGELGRAGRLAAYQSYFPDERRSALRYYPVADYLTRIACAGALIASPPRVYEGIFEISRGNVRTLANSLLGRALFRVLARDPVRLTEQGVATRRQTHTYGQWEILRRGPRTLEVVYQDEYQWIEWICAGAAQGTFEACGIEAVLTTTLVSRFHGSTIISW